MPQLECPTCSLKFQEKDAVVQCIDCKTRKHAHCARVDPKKVGKRHWRCKECSQKKDPDKKPKSAVSRPPPRQLDTKKEEHNGMAAGDSPRQSSKHGLRNPQDYEDKDPWEMQFSRSLQKLKHLEELVVLLKDKYYEVSKKNDELETELTTYKLKVENLEQRSRKNTVEVWGVPLTEKEHLSSIVTRLFHAIGFIDKQNQVESIGKERKTDADFYAGIRLARLEPTVPRTVIWINFVTNKDKEEFMNKWKAGEQNGGLSVRRLGIDEDGLVKVETSLTTYKLQLFQRAIDYANEFKYQRVGVHDGEIYILRDIAGGPLVFIKSPQDFERLADLDMQNLVNEKVKAAAAETAEERKQPWKSQSTRSASPSFKEATNKTNRSSLGGRRNQLKR